MEEKKVSIIIPTRNRSEMLRQCLDCLKNQTYKNIEIIVVDGNSELDDVAIAKQYTDMVFVFPKKGDHRCAQRNLGVEKASGEYVLIIDSDMELTPKVVESCVDIMDKSPSGRGCPEGVGEVASELLINSFASQKSENNLNHITGITIPERGKGEGFLAKCKALEKSFYVGVDWMEAARFYRRADFLAVGGYDEQMTSGEDWDLSQRIGKLGRIARTAEFLDHNEGRISLWSTMKKKYYYAGEFAKYMKNAAHKDNVSQQTGIISRYKLFFNQPKKLFRQPLVGFGLLFMKTCEFGFGGLGYLKGRIFKGRNSDLVFISRPLQELISGTGEQVVAGSIVKCFLKYQMRVDYIRQSLVPAYGSLMSLIFYDWFFSFYKVINSGLSKTPIVFFGSPFQTVFIFLIRFLFRRTKSVVIIHDLFFCDYNKSLFDKYAHLLYFQVALSADHIITTTDENALKFEARFKRKPEVILLGAADDLLYQKKDISALNSIGYIGSYNPRKRIDRIFKFLSSRSDGKIAFHFAGNMTRKFRDRAESLGNHHQIIIHGSIKESVKNDFYGKISFLYFPTELEGFGLPLLEALKTGVMPIVHHDAEIPKCLKTRCQLIDQPEEIFEKLDYYKKNFSEFEEQTLANYEYSKKFDYSNFYYFIKKIGK